MVFGRPHEIFFLILAFISELIGTLTGFGSSTFFVPIATFLEDLQTVLVITGFLHIAGNISKLILFRGIDKRFVLKFGAATLIPIAAGAALSNFFSQNIYKLIIGCFLILASLLFLLSARIENYLRNRKSIAYGLGAVSGFLTGLVGTGGAIRGLALAGLGLSKESFIATSAAVDLAGDILRTVMYVNKGYLTHEHSFYLWYLFPIAFVGAWLGKKIIKRWTEKFFLNIVLIGIFLMGVATLIESFLES